MKDEPQQWHVLGFECSCRAGRSCDDNAAVLGSSRLPAVNSLHFCEPLSRASVVANPDAEQNLCGRLPKADILWPGGLAELKALDDFDARFIGSDLQLGEVEQRGDVLAHATLHTASP